MSFTDRRHEVRARWRTPRGFTLVELAMVLFIVALLLGGLLVPLATQLEARQRSEAQLELQEIREALIGYAIANDACLPCYANSTDGVSEVMATCTADPSADQYLPWSTLGLNDGLDPWNQYWRYRVDQNFACSTSTIVTISSSAAIDVGIRELDGTNSDIGAPVFNQMVSTTEYPVAIVYSTGANQVADHENAEYEATPYVPPTTGSLYEAGPVSNLDRDNDGEDNADKFDDLLIWLSRPQMFYKLVNAEVLP